MHATPVRPGNDTGRNALPHLTEAAARQHFSKEYAKIYSFYSLLSGLSLSCPTVSVSWLVVLGSPKPSPVRTLALPIRPYIEIVGLVKHSHLSDCRPHVFRVAITASSFVGAREPTSRQSFPPWSPHALWLSEGSAIVFYGGLCSRNIVQVLLTCQRVGDASFGKCRTV